MKKVSFHILFWLYISLYVFDYFIDQFNFVNSVTYTAFEIVLYATEVYLNLFFLIPVILLKKGKFAYFISLLILLFFTCSSYFILNLNNELLSQNFSRSIYTFFLNHILFIFISYFAWYYEKYFSEKQKRLTLENEKLQSEMIMLKSQISPHFLFNTLNNIYSLTLSKSDDAPKMLASVSDILRYFIYEGNKNEVFLESEIEVISKYIQIQEYRQIPGMKNIQFKINGDTSVLKVPPLIFMTLIENAFKHGDIVEKKEGFVNISFNISGNKIEFVIANSYQPKEISNGIGLINVKSQLDVIYGRNYQLNINEENLNYKVSLILYGI